ncbi:hypothetical protein [Geobacter sp. AOG1]|uniref:hypothetical protein n=1 Tax=Geobacter sp. AOG1 TaxID=1566346 RepID=UPI001CC7D8FB|nr:hypothetical protein [Geobacter sp. AOG1]GFE59325.1 hypothetical protein AOG1_32050 [Geobacter sp. AOG1]
MGSVRTFVIACCMACCGFVSPLLAAEEGGAPGEGTIFTLWPLVDYRESPHEQYRNLSLLGPLLKFERHGDDSTLAARPLLYRTEDRREQTAQTSYLYPLASTDSSPRATTFQVMQLLQKNVYRKGEEGEEHNSQFFPFYLQGRSNKYGPYTSVFPLYGDIYERLWRDEIHFVLFPLYSRTVNRGTTSRNYLYPFFNTIEGDKESGFQFWPLYGQAAKDGVYRKRFLLWPFFLSESRDLNTNNPKERRYIFPFYSSLDSPQRTSRYYLWPFFGHTVDRGNGEAREEPAVSSFAFLDVYEEQSKGKLEEWDYFWPFWYTVRSPERTEDSWLPFYARTVKKETEKTWYMWPLYRTERLDSPLFRQDRDRLLYWLYSDNRESWPVDGMSRRKMAFWPLFVYTRDPRGVMGFSFPAPVEPILDKEGIEKNWAPFWRIYQQRWNEQGDSAASLLWNLYWHEARGKDLAYELFPLLAYRKESQFTDFRFLKGLIGYRNQAGTKRLTLFWLPFGIDWGEVTAAQSPATLPAGAGSTP